MIKLSSLKHDEKVRVVDIYGHTFEGYICNSFDEDAFFDPDDEDTLHEESICLNTDKHGGPFLYQSEIKELTLLND